MLQNQPLEKTTQPNKWQELLWVWYHSFFSCCLVPWLNFIQRFLYTKTCCSFNPFSAVSYGSFPHGLFHSRFTFIDLGTSVASFYTAKSWCIVQCILLHCSCRNAIKISRKQPKTCHIKKHKHLELTKINLLLFVPRGADFEKDIPDTLWIKHRRAETHWPESYPNTMGNMNETPDECLVN